MGTLSSQTTNTSPSRTADAVIVVKDYGGSPADTKVPMTNFMDLAPLPLVGGFFNATPADNTTYYFGIHYSLAPTTSAATRRIYMPRAGTIITCDVQIQCTAGSSETSTLYIRKNNTSDTTVTSAINLSATPYHELKTGLNISVAAGDYIEFKWATPAGGWATNPTSVYGWMVLILA